jgi:hypothetical protein
VSTVPPDALVPTTPKPAPARRISKRLRRAIDLLADGTCKTQKAAAERAGIGEEHFSRMLGRPEIKALFIERASRTIVSGAPRAAAKMLDIMDGGSAHAAFNASEFLLKANGLGPSKESNSNVNINIGLEMRAGYVIDLSERKRDKVIEQEQDRDAS